MAFTFHATSTQENLFLDGDCRRYNFGSLLFAYMDCDWMAYKSRFDSLVTVGDGAPGIFDYPLAARQAYSALHRDFATRHPYLSLALEQQLEPATIKHPTIACLWNDKKYLWQYATDLFSGDLVDYKDTICADDLSDFSRVVKSCIQDVRAFCNVQTQHYEVFYRYISAFLLSQTHGKQKTDCEAEAFRQDGKYHKRFVELLQQVTPCFDVFTPSDSSDFETPIRYYQADCIEHLVAFELTFFSEFGIPVRACANCGSFFIPRTKASLYCNRIQPSSGKSCQQTAPKDTYAAKMDANNMRKAFARNRAAYLMRCKRAPHDKKLEREYKSWNNNISLMLERIQCGEGDETKFWEAVEISKRKYVKKSKEGE